MSYVYIRSEPMLWTVGFYDPQGKFQSESDHGSTVDAAKRCNYLNGGRAADPEMLAALHEARAYIDTAIDLDGSVPDETAALLEIINGAIAGGERCQA